MISLDEAQKIVEHELLLERSTKRIDISYFREDSDYFDIPVIRSKDESGIGAPSFLVRKSDGKLFTPAFHPFTPLGKRMLKMRRVDL